MVLKLREHSGFPGVQGTKKAKLVRKMLVYLLPPSSNNILMYKKHANLEFCFQGFGIEWLVFVKFKIRRPNTHHMREYIDALMPNACQKMS